MKKVRLQFDFTEEQTAVLDGLCEHLDATSRAEVVRRAIRLMEYVLDRLDKGTEVLVRDKDGDTKTLEQLRIL